MASPSSPVCWALLIGINCYPVDDKTEPLEGCVRDVEQLYQYLQSVGKVRTKVLKASLDKDSETNQPPEPEAEWPTYPNVLSEISSILDRAHAGDVVLIHFSGHGVKLPNPRNGDLGLVLYDPVSGTRYLKGLKLADQLKKMVDKGLKPVLVLDCCYSGAVLRDDHGCVGKVREAVYNIDIDHLDTDIQPHGEEPLLNVPKRDATLEPDWLLNPRGYGILTACGPHERSRELKFSDGTRKGPLSHCFLLSLSSMQRSKVGNSLQSIYDYVSVQFHSHLIRLSPRRYGNRVIELFGQPEAALNPLVTKVWWKDNQLLLAAGQIHGVSKGDEYDLQAPWGDQRGSRSRLVCKVKAVNALNCVLEVDSATSKILAEETAAWRAVPCNHLSSRHLTVVLSPSINCNEWIDAAQPPHFLKLVKASPKITVPTGGVYLNLNNDGAYQILDDNMRGIPNVPMIPVNSSSVIHKTIHLLDHIAKFNFIERLENRVPDPDFEQSIKLRLRDTKGRFVENTGSLSLNHGDKVELWGLNLSADLVYLFVFNLSPTWCIRNVLERKHGDYKDLPSNKKEFESSDAYIKLLGKTTMTIPDSLEHVTKCEDIMKVFITKAPISLSSLCLPAMIPYPGTVTRSDDDCLEEALAKLSPATRNAPNTTREQSWLTRNFVIHTSR